MIYPILWIILAFVIWIFSFFGFLSLKLNIFSDAASYFEHIQYFIVNLRKGVFPLWDPHWFHGVSNEFFLRRFSAYNPFYFIIVFFESIGIRYSLAYLWFLAFYYWSGAIAFYLLGMRLYQNRWIAYAGYLMLLFSALGTRFVDSYMLLITVPVIWFFYFLVSFTQKPSKHSFVGMCLFFVILVTTYIPFYFLSFLALFVILFAAIYASQVSEILKKYWDFFKKNTILVIASLLVVLLSFMPLLMFYLQSNKGQIVMSVRHGTDATQGILTVPLQTIDWGAVEDLMFSGMHSDLSTYTFAIVYIPFFAIIVFVLGLFFRVSRAVIFMFLCGLILFCCIVPHGLPFYNFLYKHVFFLKYFRNLHFFLWFILIPLFILLVLEHWKVFIQNKNSLSKNKLLIMVGGVHLATLIFVWMRADAIITTYIMIVLSSIFWAFLILGRLKENFWAFGLLTLVVVIQPAEVYYHLSSRAEKAPARFYEAYESYGRELKLVDNDSPELFQPQKIQLYYASSHYNLLYQNVDNAALQKYLQYKFILFDEIDLVNPARLDFAHLNQNLLNKSNKAIVFEEERVAVKVEGTDPAPGAQFQGMGKETKGFQILSFDANHVKISIQIPYEKFLVYNDSFDPAWEVKVDGHKARLYQTNVAFKGVWVKAGKHTVEFRYGSWKQYLLNYVLVIATFMLLVSLLWFAYRSRRDN